MSTTVPPDVLAQARDAAVLAVVNAPDGATKTTLRLLATTAAAEVAYTAGMATSSPQEGGGGTPDDDANDDGSLSPERSRRVAQRGRDLHAARSRALVDACSYVVGRPALLPPGQQAGEAACWYCTEPCPPEPRDDPAHPTCRKAYSEGLRDGAAGVQVDREALLLAVARALHHSGGHEWCPYVPWEKCPKARTAAAQTADVLDALTPLLGTPGDPPTADEAQYERQE